MGLIQKPPKHNTLINYPLKFSEFVYHLILDLRDALI
jgi:hypothetical protein